MTLLQDSLSGLKVNDVMTQNVISVPATISINELVQNYFYRYLFISFPVVNQGGELIGMVSVKQVKDIPQNRWHEKKVEDIMTATSGINVLDSDDEAFNAFNLLMKNELGRLPVVHGNKLAGIITRRDIMTLLTIRSDLGA
jgi:predicted transcriptional regulator